jgi:hypothetical protein
MFAKIDVVLSFAGADRQVAWMIAETLLERGLHVFIDEFAGSELWGKDLYDHLKTIYEESRLCVVIVSKNYVQSNRAQIQWRNLVAHSGVKDSFTVLPVIILGYTDTEPLTDTGLLKGIGSMAVKAPLQEIIAIVLSKLHNLPPAPEARPVERYHVIRRDSGWSVKRQGAARAASVHKTRKEAIRAAHRITVRNEPAEIIVHRPDGTILSRKEVRNN